MSGARRWLAGCAAAALCGAAFAADPGAAEEQYRVGRRLAAERAPGAAEALARVVALDPLGPLADDARVEHALLVGVAAWPAELGRIDAASAARARQLLDAVARIAPPPDRAAEARYLRALLRLEPGEHFDPAAARAELTALATAVSPWSEPARHARAWLDEQEGNASGARAAYQRIVIDAPRSPAAGRARAGLGRVHLARGECAAAARWFHEALAADLPDDATTRALRELAVRCALGGPEPGAAPLEPRGTVDGMRAPSMLCAMPGGGVVVGERKSGLVVELGADARELRRWSVSGVHALAASPLGVIFAAAGDEVLRLVGSGGTERHAGLGDFAPVSALAADALGRIFVLDRRGERAGRLAPGSDAPERLVVAEDARFEDLAWGGGRLVALDARNRALWAFDSAADAVRFDVATTNKPARIAVDAARRPVIFDARSRALFLLHADGSARGAVGLVGTGVERVAALAVGQDGTLHLLDETTGAWWVLP